MPFDDGETGEFSVESASFKGPDLRQSGCLICLRKIATVLAAAPVQGIRKIDICRMHHQVAAATRQATRFPLDFTGLRLRERTKVLPR